MANKKFDNDLGEGDSNINDLISEYLREYSEYEEAYRNSVYGSGSLDKNCYDALDIFRDLSEDEEFLKLTLAGLKYRGKLNNTFIEFMVSMIFLHDNGVEDMTRIFQLKQADFFLREYSKKSKGDRG